MAPAPDPSARRSLLCACLTLAFSSACGGNAGDEAPRPDPGPAAPRNVLITLIDTCAAGHLATYGYDRETTPFLDRLAGESVVFADATAAASYTLASVASLLTGRSTELHGVAHPGDTVPSATPLLAEAFDAAGFETVGVSTNAHISEDFGFARGFDRFAYVPIDLRDGRPMQVPTQVLAGIESFLAEPPEAPFFAYWHLLPPHAPYAPPEPFPSVYASHVPDQQLARSLWKATGTMPLAGFSAEELSSLVDLYDSSLRYIDSVLEGIHRDLERSGLLDETLWIVVSDHGEAFGEHQMLQHSSTVFQELVHVPLLMRFPDGRRARVEQPVGLVDLFPTLAELYDLDVPSPPSGLSLLPLIDGADAGAERSLFTNATPRNERTGLRRGDFKLVRDDRKGTYRLFDLRSDPRESLDVGAAHPERLASMRAELDARVALWKAGSRAGSPGVLDPEIEAQLRAIGYADELDARLPPSEASVPDDGPTDAAGGD